MVYEHLRVCFFRSCHYSSIEFRKSREMYIYKEGKEVSQSGVRLATLRWGKEEGDREKREKGTPSSE